jgi:hypothetical protein
MSSNTTLITVADFADYADISAYLSTDYITPHLLSAQEQFLRPLLGDSLYSELQDQVAAENETAANITLLEKIKPFLVYRSYQNFLLHHGVYSTNMGLRIYKDENSEELDPGRRAAISNHAGNLAGMYESQLRKFLCDNATTYPLYDSGETTAQQVVPRITKVAPTHRKPSNDFRTWNGNLQ